jgi:predicted transcriptional regulator
MSPVKESVIKLVESLPDDCTVEDIQYHLYVRDKVLRGSQAIDEGRIQSHEEVGRRLDQWAESYGLTRQ